MWERERDHFRVTEICWHHCFMSLITRFEFSGVIFPSQALSPRWIPQKVGKSLLCLFNSTVERSVCALHERQERVRDKRRTQGKDDVLFVLHVREMSGRWDKLGQTAPYLYFSYTFHTVTCCINLYQSKRQGGLSQERSYKGLLPAHHHRALLIGARLIVGLL